MLKLNKVLIPLDLAQTTKMLQKPYHSIVILVLYFFYTLGGIAGVTFLRIIVLLFTFGFLFLIIYRKEYFHISIFVSLFALICQLKRIRFAHILPYGIFLYLSVFAIRNIPLFAIIATPITIRHLHGILDFSLKKKQKRYVTGMPIYVAIVFCWIVFSAGIGVFIANDALYRRLQYLRTFGIGESGSFPMEAVDYLKEKDIAGNIFNSSEIGGYLIRKMYPQKQVALDGRWEVYEDFLENIQRLQNPFYFAQLVAQYKIRAIILYKRSLEIQLMLPWLQTSPFWLLTKNTPNAIVFERNIG